tara:strand:- start:1026 stop:1271 length:246 start_codon:yes stop_codon:yes gene_type:complete
MYQDKINNLEKLVRILELINQLQRYNLTNSNYIKDINNGLDDCFNMSSYYKSRIAKNELIINRLKKYYNSTFNKLTTFKTN